ncbi:MAG TPA: four helix bundle protein [Thermoanaerobaculia bacterium]|jgi:four helix bundle protein|nr:four helix bundle protein [Thermoanaerobaculia bacterium]
MREYRNTTAYQLARGLVVSVYGAAPAPPAPPAPPIAALRRAAITAAANLVEGSTLASPGDYLRCLETARAALAEFPRQVNLCQLRGHLSPQAARLLLAEQAEASAALGRLIAEAAVLAS